MRNKSILDIPATTPKKASHISETKQEKRIEIDDTSGVCLKSLEALEVSLGEDTVNYLKQLLNLFIERIESGQFYD